MKAPFARAAYFTRYFVVASRLLVNARLSAVDFAHHLFTALLRRSRYIVIDRCYREAAGDTILP